MNTNLESVYVPKSLILEVIAKNKIFIIIPLLLKITKKLLVIRQFLKWKSIIRDPHSKEFNHYFIWKNIKVTNYTQTY